MKVLITGGAGFVGSNLAIKLKADHPDYHIISFDNLKRRGSELSIERLKQTEVDFEIQSFHKPALDFRLACVI